MTSVSDKLRACANGGKMLEEMGFRGTGYISENAYEVFGIESHSNMTLFRAIADAIDAEERELRDFCEKLNALADAREEVDLFGQAYVPLPLDADGMPIRIGDTMEYDAPSGKKMRVVKAVGGESFFGCEITPPITGKFEEYVAPCHHHHKSTIEDLLREFADEYDSVSGYAPDENEVLAKYAKLLRLKEGE